MIETADFTLKTEGAQAFNAHLARPQQGRHPGVVLLHDMFGLYEPIRTVAKRCAEHGIAAVAPNLFWRADDPGVIPYDAGQHPRAWERLKALDLDRSARDMKVAVDWLRGQPFCNGKVATIGFCGGGRLAFLVAARCGVDGAASLYGLGISQHLADLPGVKCPLQLHYGGNDLHVPQSEVDAVAAGVRGHPGTELFVYPGAGHSFANPVRPTYDAAATALAWSRIDAMMDGLR